MIRLGEPLLGHEPERDAVHVPIYQATAAHTLHPGQHVGLNDNGNASTSAPKIIGIVDPFLSKPVEKDQRFYILVFPDDVKKLHHVWEHDTIDSADFARALVTPPVIDPEDLDDGDDCFSMGCSG